MTDIRQTPRGSAPHQFSLLHISDIHERVELPWMDAERRAKIGLRKAARHRVLGPSFREALKDVLSLGRVDAVCLTGDVADWGLIEEYAQATERLEVVLAVLELPKDRLFAIPGNHDINQTKAKEAWRELREVARESPGRLSDWMGGMSGPRGVHAAHRDDILTRSAAFWDWLCAFRGDEVLHPKRSPHGLLGYRHTLAGFPFEVEIVGLDSAWLAGDDHDAGKLFLSDAQIDRLCTDREGKTLPGFCAALVHHPLSALLDDLRMRDLLGQYVDLVLHGHQHEAQAEDLTSPDRHLLALAAGSLFEGDVGDRWTNAFHRVDVFLDNAGHPLRYELTFWCWSERGHWHRSSGFYKTDSGGRLVIQVSDGGRRAFRELGAKADDGPAVPLEPRTDRDSARLLSLGADLLDPHADETVRRTVSWLLPAGAALVLVVALAIGALALRILASRGSSVLGLSRQATARTPSPGVGIATNVDAAIPSPRPQRLLVSPRDGSQAPAFERTPNPPDVVRAAPVKGNGTSHARTARCQVRKIDGYWYAVLQNHGKPKYDQLVPATIPKRDFSEYLQRYNFEHSTDCQ